MSRLSSIIASASVFVWIVVLLMLGGGHSPIHGASSPDGGLVLKSAINPFSTVEEFPSFEAQQIRFTIFRTNGRTPCIDELEVFTDESEPRNVALFSNGAQVTTSGPSHLSGKFDSAQAVDGAYGKQHAWLSHDAENVWIQIDLPQAERINRIVWSRDRTRTQWDRVPVEYRIELASNGEEWTEVASSKERLPGLVFGTQEVSWSPTSQDEATNQILREPVNAYLNKEEFSSRRVKYVRFNIHYTAGRSPCIDEVEVYSKNRPEHNLALAEHGGVASSSNVHESDLGSINLNDGRFGKSSRWIGEDSLSGWVQVQLPELTNIDRVVWSSNRSGGAIKGVPIEYSIEVATELGKWIEVASSVDRRKTNRLGLYPETRAPSDYLVDTWEGEDGLPLNSINDFAETPDGYLWIATDRGLLRFDGHEFTMFDQSNTPSISTPKIYDLYADRTGRLWIVNQKFFYNSKNNLVLYDNGVFHRIEVRSPHKVLDLFEEGDGQLWLYTDQGALPWVDGQIDYDGLLRGFRLERMEYDRISNGVEERVRWKGVPGQWLHGGFQPLVGGNGYPVELSAPIVYARQLSRYDGGGWILANGLSAGKNHGVNLTCRLFPDGRLSEPVPVPWASTPFGCRWRLVDRANNLWLSSPEYGLNCLLAEGNQFLSFADTPGLAGHSIRKMYEDSNGNIWLATLSGGLKSLRKRAIKVIDTTQGMATIYSGTIPDNVYSLSPSREGGVWIGNHTGGAYHWNEGHLSSLLNAHSNSWAIFEDSRGAVWSGAYDKGVRYHDKNGRFVSVPTVESHPLTFLEDKQGRIWTGGDFGLACYDHGAVSGFAPPYFRKTGFEWVISLLEGADGELWVGTKLGFLFRFRNGRFETIWKSVIGQEYPVCSLFIDRTGALWMARFGFGLTRFKNGHCTHFTPSEGLPASSINGILDDGQGTLWMTSKHGVFRISYEAFEAFSQGNAPANAWSHFTKKDGLPDNTCQGEQNQPSLCRTSDGRIWIPTLAGVGCIDPNAIQTQNTPPPVVIQDVTLYGDDSSVVTLLSDGAFSSHTDKTPLELIVPPGINNILVRYTAIDFVEPKRVNFFYRIVGLDDNWVNAKNERTTLITRLAPGAYQFELKASNHRGQMGEVAKIAFVVQPFWWETAVFRSLFAVGLLMSGIMWFSFRLKALTRKNEQQADFSRLLIEREEMERKRISQALHDSLGHELLLVRNRALDGANHAGTAQVQQQFESISQMAGQALENARGMAYNLRPFELDRIGFRKAIETMISKISESSKARYFKEIEDLDGILPSADLVHLYRLIQEGLNNILKHAEASVVMLEIKQDGRCVLVQLDDNGVGFDSGRSASGLGVNGIMERAKLIGGEFSLSTAPGKGTQIRIRIPL